MVVEHKMGIMKYVKKKDFHAPEKCREELLISVLIFSLPALGMYFLNITSEYDLKRKIKSKTKISYYLFFRHSLHFALTSNPDIKKSKLQKYDRKAQ